MKAPLRTRALALAGLAALVPVALGLVRGSITIEAAAVRAGVLLVALVVIDRLVVPVIRELFSPAPDSKQ